MNSIIRLLARLSLLSLLLLLSACRGNKGDQSSISDDLYNDDLNSVGQFGEWDENMLPESRGAIENMSPVDSSAYAPVYFAFDSYTVSPGEVMKIRSVADALLSSPAQAVILQGHTDERGSREYNLALGERRALAVRELLQSMGVTSDRIQTLSMGEESPAVVGFDESAWSLNRRVQFQLMQ
ncbi:MAG: OmpA family protein [Kiritimatiellia bacterium]